MQISSLPPEDQERAIKLVFPDGPPVARTYPPPGHLFCGCPESALRRDENGADICSVCSTG